MKFKLSYAPLDKLSVRPPQSKSYAQRALLIASLAIGKSRVIINDRPDDVRVMMNTLKSFGVRINGSTVHGSMPENPGRVIMCGESGATMRFLTSYSTLVDRGYVVLTGRSGLLRRPIQPLIDAILSLGGWAVTMKGDGYPPVIVRASRMSGGEVVIGSSDSSQYTSSLMMVAPYFSKSTTIMAENLVSRPYVDMTVYVMKKFGVEVKQQGNSYTVHNNSVYSPAEFEPPADASSAMFFMSLALLSGRGILLRGISNREPQADLTSMLAVLNQLQVPYKMDYDGLEISKSRIRGSLTVNLRDSPDSLPPVSVLGLRVQVRVSGVRHTRFKESDRLTAIASELTKLGAKVEENEDGITVNPPEEPRRGIRLNGWNDHRIVMAMAVADAALELGSTIEGYETVRKSYPRFFDDMAGLGYRVVSVE